MQSTSGSINSNYSYDANGNMLSGNGRTLSWISFNQPDTIKANAATVSYRYGTDHQRVKQIQTNLTTYYMHGNNGQNLFYEEDKFGDKRSYISAGGRVVAVLVKGWFQSQAYYWHTDPLGI